TDGYVRVGSGESGNTYHPNGHFGTADANDGLRQIASDYRATAFPTPQFPNGQPDDRRLLYNDQSLRLGGKFDITADFTALPAPNWRRRGPHGEHRVGINCDVSTNSVPNEMVTIDGVSQRRRAVLETLFINRGSTRTRREFSLNHWHLRFEFSAQQTATTDGGSVPVDEVPAAVPGRIEVEAYDDTGDDGTLGSFVPDSGPVDPNFPGIIYNYPQVFPIAGDEEASYVPTAGGQWMNYTVNIAATGSYTFAARVASPHSGNTFHVEVDGVDRTGPIYIPNTGSGDAYQSATVEDIWLDAGRHVVRIVIDGAGQGKGNFDYFTLNPYTPPQEECSPYPWQLQNCWNNGGYWDYDNCWCNYGPIGY
ncbi:MAG: carbohydrate-binding protein, partial [Pyrinomonadaceae bacterium]